MWFFYYEGANIVNEKLSSALSKVEISYGDIAEIADGMLRAKFAPINKLIDEINTNLNAMSIEFIRDYLLRLQLWAYSISELRDKSAAKAELAAALQKEAYAIKFNGADGSAAARDKFALAETSQEQVSEIIYNLVANLVKTKLDQCHRLVDCLKSALASRMQEFKFANVGSTAEVPQLVDGKFVVKE